MYTYKFPRAALTVDAVVFSKGIDKTEVLLIQRGKDPWKGKWAIPGGFLEVDETCETGAKRELEEETGLTGISLKQFHVFDAVDRDPRERIITVAYYGFTNKSKHQAKGSDDASDARWFDIENLPDLAADHKKIIAKAREEAKRNNDW